jgi:uncharacterized protein
MFGLLRLVKNLASFDGRKARDDEKQVAEGYRITATGSGPETYVTYHDGDREIGVIAKFSWSNDVLLYTDSLKRWSVPYNAELTEFDFQRVLNRVMSYLSCWGKVSLDHSELPTQEDLKKSLIDKGIEFEELENGVLRYSIDADTLWEGSKKRRKDKHQSNVEK